MDWKLSLAGLLIGLLVGTTGMGVVAATVALVCWFAGRCTPQVAEADTG